MTDRFFRMWQCLAYGAGVVLAACVIVGCATTDTANTLAAPSAELEKELSAKPFRGRWWNYYDRAAILVRYEEYEAAEAHLRSALAKRGRDARWARTYGLHFTPEYFPNRELGIVLYHQGDYGEAEAFLESSLEQTFSARGAHYLDRARQDRIRGSVVDTEGPLFEILTPQLAEATAALSIDFSAEVRDSNFVHRIELNGEEYSLDVSARVVRVEQSVPLVPGSNEILLVAEDLAGNRSEYRFTIATDHDGPAVSFDETAPGAPIRGYAYDPAGVVAVSIGGRELTLTDAGGGVQSFVYAASGLLSEEATTFESRDGLGNVTQGSLPGQPERNAVARLAWNGPVGSLPTLDEPFLRFAVDEELSGPRIAFTNLAEGQRYVSGQIAVNLLAESLEPIERIVLNGAPVPGLVPGRRIQRITRRVGLSEAGTHQMLARVVDARGAESTASITIERRLPTVFNEEDRLRVTVLGNLWHGLDADSETVSAFISDELSANLQAGRRFKLQDRELLSLVLSEQELSAALSNSSDRVRLGRTQPVDYFLIGEVRRFGKNMEVILHAVRTETGEEVLVDVYGPAANAEEVSNLVDLLGVRLAQQFPRVRGEITRVRSSGMRLTSSLNESDRVHRSLPCIVYREVEIFDPQTRKSLGVDWIPIAEGIFSNVRRNDSVVRLTEDENASTPTVQDHIITK